MNDQRWDNFNWTDEKTKKEKRRRNCVGFASELPHHLWWWLLLFHNFESYRKVKTEFICGIGAEWRNFRFINSGSCIRANDKRDVAPFFFFRFHQFAHAVSVGRKCHRLTSVWVTRTCDVIGQLASMRPAAPHTIWSHVHSTPTDNFFLIVLFLYCIIWINGVAVVTALFSSVSLRVVFFFSRFLCSFGHLSN